jgi:hypothetical protein
MSDSQPDPCRDFDDQALAGGRAGDSQGTASVPKDAGALLQARAQHTGDGALHEWAVQSLRTGWTEGIRETPCGTLCGEDALIQDQDGSLCGACWLAKERNGQDEPSGSCSPEPEASIPGLRGAGAELEGL